MIKIVAVLGATAAGKSSLGVDLARRFTGEIIACDSRQIYRGLETGTGKATPEERKEIRHHLMDVIDPDENINAACYRDLARQAVREIDGREHRVFLVGGTGLYLRAFLGLLFPGGEGNREIRDQIEEKRKKEGDGFLYQWLFLVDPESAAQIHAHDIYRITRALEIYLTTGSPASQMKKKNCFPDPDYQVLKVGLRRDPVELLDRISERIEWMYESGLEGRTIVDEVEGLLRNDYDLRIKAFSTIGYREAVSFFHGEINREEAKEKTRRATWGYARRQMTWFRKEAGIRWFHPRLDAGEIIAQVEKFLE
ncbi:MAG: tRNA (adenosine(37)-N6)-dimethylallyltransferase MiaA [Proteobacteria bacterium]|nr:tRNA (adenosine(37)-N6)-dimethylallyltransferase MiaA [Pseudomonadota bacterium]